MHPGFAYCVFAGKCLYCKIEEGKINYKFDNRIVIIIKKIPTNTHLLGFFIAKMVIVQCLFYFGPKCFLKFRKPNRENVVYRLSIT